MFAVQFVVGIPLSCSVHLGMTLRAFLAVLCAACRVDTFSLFSFGTNVAFMEASVLIAFALTTATAPLSL
jgi:hypothetical protein